MSEPRYPFVRVDVDADLADEISAELFDLGALGVEERDATTLQKGVEGKVTLVASFPDHEAAHEAIAALDPAWSPALEEIVGDAWRDAWKEHFHPFPLTPSITIRPPWEPYEASRPGEQVLELEPGRAFGTGLHATTSLVARTLDAERSRLQGVRLLDVGTGSGILALVALCLGAAFVVATDNDPEVLDVVRENAARNALAARLDASTRDLHELDELFPVVVANIEARVLLPMAPALMTRVAPRGLLVLSGILAGQEPDLRAAYQGLVELRTEREGDWVCMVFERPLWGGGWGWGLRPGHFAETVGLRSPRPRQRGGRAAHRFHEAAPSAPLPGGGRAAHRFHEAQGRSPTHPIGAWVAKAHRSQEAPGAQALTPLQREAPGAPSWGVPVNFWAWKWRSEVGHRFPLLFLTAWASLDRRGPWRYPSAYQGKQMTLARYVETLSLLGDESRLRLCALLRRRELSVGELVRVTGLSQSRVSTHLARLREVGLVSDRREGAHSIYALAPGAMAPAVKALLEEATEASDPTLENDHRRLRELDAGTTGGLPFATELGRPHAPGRTWPSLAAGLSGLLRLGDVLDVGCGDGAVASFLAPFCRSLTCIDVDPRMAEAARLRLASYPQARVSVADAATFPCEGEAFDEVLIFHTLCHAEAPGKLVRRCGQLLRPGGRLVVLSLDEHEAQVGAPAGELHGGFSAGKLRGMLRRAGLEVRLCGVASQEARRPQFRTVLAVAERPG